MGRDGREQEAWCSDLQETVLKQDLGEGHDITWQDTSAVTMQMCRK